VVTAPGNDVRAGRTRRRTATARVAVTGATSPLGRLLVGRLRSSKRFDDVIAVDGDALPELTGVAAVVHLAGDRDPASPAAARRAANVATTRAVLDAAVGSVNRVVLLTSAMVYGAEPDNDIPLAEDAPLRAEAGSTLVGDWLEIENLAARYAQRDPTTTLTCIRPAALVGAVADAPLRIFDAPRLLALRGGRPAWQFCHTDDLTTALELAAAGTVTGALTVGCDGWLTQQDVEHISGLRSLVVPAAVAIGTAERLHRIGVVPTPASELRFLAAPWVVGAQTLRAAGWAPTWTNADALAAHLATNRGDGPRDGRGRRDATRAAAGAAVAVVGAVAVARARAARRRRLP
jgi:nucleoside-diphosphate-sugar epimerase